MGGEDRKSPQRGKPPGSGEQRGPPPPPKPIATAMSLSPGRAGGALKVAYSATPLNAQREVKNVILRIATIPAVQDQIPIEQLALPMTVIYAWTQLGIHANPATYTSPAPPAQQVADPDPRRRILYEMQVDMGPAGMFAADESVTIRVALLQ